MKQLTVRQPQTYNGFYIQTVCAAKEHLQEPGSLEINFLAGDKLKSKTIKFKSWQLKNEKTHIFDCGEEKLTFVVL